MQLMIQDFLVIPGNNNDFLPPVVHFWFFDVSKIIRVCRTYVQYFFPKSKCESFADDPAESSAGQSD